MVNSPIRSAAEAERALALGYAPPARREALRALFALDARLGDVLRTTREPIVGQMRLAWWRDALAALGGGPAPAEPVLVALATEVLPLGITGEALSGLCDGWEHLLASPLDGNAMASFAGDRGGLLFRRAAEVLGNASFEIDATGEGWALADLTARLSDRAAAEEARALASLRLARMPKTVWPRALRPLGALALLARDDLAGGTPGSPRRIARLLVLRLTGV